jgi:hypothetical protein
MYSDIVAVPLLLGWSNRMTDKKPKPNIEQGTINLMSSLVRLPPKVHEDRRLGPAKA